MLMFLTRRVVISFTLPAEKCMSSASNAYLMGRFARNNSSCCLVSKVALPERFVLHMGRKQSEGGWTRQEA